MILYDLTYEDVVCVVTAGRAWLFTALNENLLECYLNCFQQNESLVEEYYVRDALVRDQDVSHNYFAFQEPVKKKICDIIFTFRPI